jgi:hypothetical protein
MGAMGKTHNWTEIFETGFRSHTKELRLM